MLSLNDHNRLCLIWACCAVLAVAVFSLWPSIDLAVSSLFFRTGQGFALAQVPLLEILRDIVWNLSLVVVTVAVIGLAVALAGRPFPWLGLRQGLFIVALYLIGPALVVDGLLKRFWGRARPANIVEFGGTRQFTPPLFPADQCAQNCSFVSGEGAAATALAIALAVLAPAVRHAAPRWGYRLYLAAAVIIPPIGIALRLMLGRHFLSDTIFAMVIVSGIALVLSRLLLTPRQG